MIGPARLVRSAADYVPAQLVRFSGPFPTRFSGKHPSDSVAPWPICRRLATNSTSAGHLRRQGPAGRSGRSAASATSRQARGDQGDEGRTG